MKFVEEEERQVDELMINEKLHLQISFAAKVGSGLLALGILGQMTAEYYVGTVVLLVGQLFMSLGAKSTVYEISINGAVIMVFSGVRIIFHLFSSKEALTARKLTALLASIVLGTSVTFSFVN